MITFILGTTAEYIKVAPVMRLLRSRGVDFQIWATDQHVDGVKEVLSDFGLPAPAAHFVPASRRRTVAKTTQVIPWLLDVVRTFFRYRGKMRTLAAGGTVIVHGDTFTTVLGALAGRLLGCRVAHIEAGMRSGSWRNPFPEEINRRLVGHIAQLHFAPTEREQENLAAAAANGAEVVMTGANTVVDALRYAMEHAPRHEELPPRFALVTLHRFELVQSREDYTDILRRIQKLSTEIPVVMMMGASERVLIDKYGLQDFLSGDILVLDKMPYLEFIGVLTRATLVITDSGGLQQECAALGIPTAIHRERTETHQGLKENILLTKLNLDVLDDFLSRPEDFRCASKLDKLHPSEIIVSHLVDVP